MFKLPNSKSSPYLFQEPINPEYSHWKMMTSFLYSFFLSCIILFFFRGTVMEMTMIWVMIPSQTGTYVSDLELITPIVCHCVCLFFSLVNNTLIKIFSFSFFFSRQMLCNCLGFSCECLPWWSFTNSSSNLEENTLPSRLGS